MAIAEAYCVSNKKNSKLHIADRARKTSDNTSHVRMDAINAETVEHY